MSYRGAIAEINIGYDGLTGSKNLAQVGPSQLLQALNISYERNTISKEGGSAKYNSTAITAAPSVIGGHDWFPSSAVQRMVVLTSAGDLLKDSGSGTFATTLVSGLTTGSIVPVFVDGGNEQVSNNKKLFVFTGVNAVQVLSGDGNTTADISKPPADWTGASQPVAGCIHEGYLWAWGNGNDPHRVYRSSLTDHEDFTTASYSLAVYPGEGDKIVAGMSFKGVLVLWKQPAGIYFIDTSASDDTQWRVIRVTSALGIASPRGAVLIDDDILFLDFNANFQLLSATSAFGDLASRNLSTQAFMNIFARDNLNFSQITKARGIYYPAKREAHFAVAGLGSTTNNRRIVIDFNRSDFPRFRFSDKDTCESFWLRKDANNIPRPVCGDDVGFVWLLDQETKSKDSAGYNAQIQTPPDDLSRLDPALAIKRKLGDFLELVCEEKGAWDISVDVQWDGVTRQTINFDMGGAGAKLGTDTILDSWTLGGDVLLTRRKRITGSGRRISLIVRNAGAGEDFSVARFLLYFRPGDERL